MNSKFIGGILLIVGTSIGGGMLALPVVNAAVGFWQSSCFLLLCWLVMTLGAFFILEVNLYLPSGKNMISMASVTLGKVGILVTWLSYLFLLYALLSAYISGGADVFGGLLRKIHLHPSDSAMIMLFTLIFGGVVFAGIHFVDWVNRGLMFAKLAIYGLLVLFITPYVDVQNLHGGEFRAIVGSLMVLLTSFGFAIIVPSLREYFNDDLSKLKKVIFVGSLIPLVCYLAWDLVIIGSMGAEGTAGLNAIKQDPHTTSALAQALSIKVNNTRLSGLFDLFLTVCMLTAFLGVSLCLSSFLSDGLEAFSLSKKSLFLFLLTFFPPTIIVMFYPGAYLYALHYAGGVCIILLMLLPVLMSIRGRSRLAGAFIVPGGQWLQWLFLFVSAGLLLFSF